MLEIETSHKLNNPNLTITSQVSKFVFKIYRKITQSRLIIIVNQIMYTNKKLLLSLLYYLMQTILLMAQIIIKAHSTTNSSKIDSIQM